MGERLNAVGIESVNDLLNADPETLAEELNHRRADADTILRWQQAATLVCCVPMLRGHDAQLLVAAEVTTPEELSASDAEQLFGIVDPIARSNRWQTNRPRWQVARSGRSHGLDQLCPASTRTPGRLRRRTDVMQSRSPRSASTFRKSHRCEGTATGPNRRPYWTPGMICLSISNVMPMHMLDD